MIAPNKVTAMPTMLSLDEEQLPELKKWKVGGKYTLVVDVEQVSMSKQDPYESLESDKKDEPKEMSARFKVLSVKPLGSKAPDRKTKLNNLKAKAQGY